MSNRSEILRRNITGFGAVLTSNSNRFTDGFHHFWIGSTGAREIKHVQFNIYHGGAQNRQVDLDWQLRHVGTDFGESTAILLADRIGITPAQSGETIFSAPSGTLGYHRGLEILFQDPVTPAAKAILDMNIEIHFLATSGREEQLESRPGGAALRLT